MATTSPFHNTHFHTVGSRALRWLLFVWAAALSGGPLLAVGSAQTCDTSTDGDARMCQALYLIVSLLLLTLACPLGVGAQTTCTESSVAVVGTGFNSGAQTSLVADCNTLLGLKDTLRNTATLNWAENLAMTSWDGVTLWPGGRVFGLSLASRDLDGTIPVALGDLDYLGSLYLANNKLTGPIPAALGNLSRLISLTLKDNSLSGPIPAALGKLNCLQHLPLNNNKLSGLPDEWEQSEEHSGPGCSLGTDPATVSFADLRSMIISDNKLSGSITRGPWDLSDLLTLSLDNNELTGEIPDALGDLSNLIGLNLNDNKLDGSIPTTLGNLSDLTMLRLHNNALSGEIPEELGNLSNLTTLYLGNNQLHGQIPDALGRLTSLQYVELYSNQLSGPIPAALEDLSNLRRLDLSRNELSGPIPGELGELSNLSNLYLNNNQLSGPIPSELERLSSLTRLSLHNNELSGPIPAELGQLTGLTHLLLYNNALLRDPLPPTFTNLTISELHLQNTQITATTTDAALETWLGGRTVTTGTQERSGTIPLDAANAAPWGLWSDGTTLWVADTAALTVFAYTLADGSRDTTMDIVLDAANTVPLGLWGDETTLWVANDWLPTQTPKVYAYTLDGTHDAPKDIDLQPVNDWPQGLWGDGTTLWVVDSSDARLYAYTLPGGSHDAANYRILDPANTAPRGLTSVGTSDGTTLYVTDVADATVYAYRNERPQAVGTLPDQMLTLADGGVAQTLLVTSAFRDPDGDALTYSAMSSDEAVATVTVSGAEVSVQPVAVGTVTITVTATDGSEMPVTQSFEVTVGDEPLPNQEPQAVGGLPAQMLTVGKVQMVPVTRAFRDPDGDELTYAVTSSNTRIATARIVSQNAEEGASRATTRSSDTRIAAVQGAEVVEVHPVAGGTVTITVTATTDADGSSQTVTQSFTVTVDGPPPPRPPRPPVTGGGGGRGRQ